MDDPQKIICRVQVGNVEVEAWQESYPDYDDSDREHDVLEFRIISRHSCQCRKAVEELPDLLQALGKMLEIVRRKSEPHAASRIDLAKLFEALEVPSPLASKGMTYQDNLNRLRTEPAGLRTSEEEMSQLYCDGHPIGEKVTSWKAEQLCAWLGTAIQDFEKVFRAKE